MDAAQIIERLNRDLKQLEERRSRLNDDLTKLTVELEEIRTQRDVFEEIVRRYGDENAQAALLDIRRATPEEEWQFLSRIEAVERVLREAKEPLSLFQIGSELATRGRHGDSQKYVSAALSHLKHKVGSVHQVGRGWWAYRSPEAGAPTDFHQSDPVSVNGQSKTFDTGMEDSTIQ